MSSLEESAAARARADFRLRGDTPEIRRQVARVRVKAQRKMGVEPDQWVIDVAEGRLPA